MNNNEQDQMNQNDAAVSLLFEPDQSDATIEQIMKIAFNERRLKITMELAGPRKELAYIYDRQTEESLTEWIPLTGDSAPVLLRTLDLLRDRVADAFVQKLAFAEMPKISDAQQVATTWAGLRELLMVPGLLPEDEANPDAVQDTSGAQESAQQGKPQAGEKIVVTRAAIRELLLPGVGSQYLPELEPDVQSAASQRVDWKPMAQTVLAEFTTAIVKKQLTKISKKLVAAIMPFGPLVAPAIGILFELINPKEPPLTMEDIQVEIDKRITKALDKEYADLLKRAFEVCLEAFDVRMQDLKNDGNVGKPGDWDDLRSATSTLQNLLFGTTGSRSYLSHQLLGDAMTMRLFALYGRLQAAKPDTIVDVELRLLRECFNGWFKYLETLLGYAWNEAVKPAVNDPKNEGDFEIYKHSKGYFVFDVYNCRDINNHNTPVRCRIGLSIDTKSKPELSTVQAMMYRKGSIFTALNTAFRSMCEVYDAAAVKHNEQFGTNLPYAMGPLFDWRLGDSLYKATMNDLAKKNTLPATGGKDQFIWSPFRREQVYQRDGNDFLREDLFVSIGSKSGRQRWYSVGDYVDLSLDGPDAVEMTEMHFPRGFRVICYSEPNFGQYHDENGKTKYKGECWVLPANGNAPYEVTHGRDVRSMKIRIDLDFWHSRPFYGRNYTWQWADGIKRPGTNFGLDHTGMLPQVADLEVIDTP